MTAPDSARRQPLDLALIGNSCVAALVDQQARIVWWCFPALSTAIPFFRGS